MAHIILRILLPLLPLPLLVIIILRLMLLLIIILRLPLLFMRLLFNHVSCSSGGCDCFFDVV